MKTTKKKQIGFYADPDVEKYLESLDSGSKTRTINGLIREELALKRQPTIAYNCAHCEKPAQGLVEYEYADYIWAISPDGYEPIHQLLFRIVRCQADGCRRASLLRIEAEEITNEEHGYTRVYPSDERLVGVPALFCDNFTKAEAAYYNHDFNAVSLYCRRIVESLCQHLLAGTAALPLKDRFEALLQRKFFDNRMALWAQKIAEIGNDVVHDVASDLDQQTAQCLLLFTKELLRASFFLREKEKFLTGEQKP